MKTLITFLVLSIAANTMTTVSMASETNSVNETRTIKKIKKDLQAIQEKYYREKAGEVLGGETEESDVRSYYVPVNTNLPVVSMKNLKKMRTNGKKFSGAEHSKSKFSQGGCDNAVKGICSAH